MTDPTMAGEDPTAPVAPLEAIVGAVTPASSTKRNVRPLDTSDPRVRRIIAITEAMGAVAERRQLVGELMAEGVPVAALAAAVGLSRTRLYAIVKPRAAK